MKYLDDAAIAAWRAERKAIIDSYVAMFDLWYNSLTIEELLGEEEYALLHAGLVSKKVDEERAHLEAMTDEELGMGRDQWDYNSRYA